MTSASGSGVGVCGDFSPPLSLFLQLDVFVCTSGVMVSQGFICGASQQKK